MVLKLIHNETSIYFEGQQIQVSVVSKDDARGLVYGYCIDQEQFPNTFVAHIQDLDLEKTWNIRFDCTAFLMENGKTIDRFYNSQCMKCQVLST